MGGVVQLKVLGWDVANVVEGWGLKRWDGVVFASCQEELERIGELRWVWVRLARLKYSWIWLGVYLCRSLGSIGRWA